MTSSLLYYKNALKNENKKENYTKFRKIHSYWFNKNAQTNTMYHFMTLTSIFQMNSMFALS